MEMSDYPCCHNPALGEHRQKERETMSSEKITEDITATIPGFRKALVQRILSNWQFDLPIFLIALLPKPRRSHRYACVCEAALSEKYSASNYPKLNFRCTGSRLVKPGGLW